MSEPDRMSSSSTDNKNTESGPSGIACAFRPLVKEVVKFGLVAYQTVSATASELGKHFNTLVEEARSETVKSPSHAGAEVANEKTDGRNQSKKDKDAPGKGL